MSTLDHEKKRAPAVDSTLREHAVLIAVIGGYFLAAAVIASIHRLPFGFLPNFSSYGLLLLVLLIFGVCWHAITVMIFVRPARLTRYLLTSLKPYLAPHRLLFAAPVLLLIPVFASTFTFFKSAIPALHPYTWDAFFSAWDFRLHGNNYPWALLQPLLGHAPITGGINFLYNLWFFIMYALITTQAFDTRNPALRMRFLLSFVLSWVVLGTLGAIYFASMGPCYDPGIPANISPYSPLLSYLRETDKIVPVWALDVQQRLWDDFQSQKPGLGSGISAMPSMHVATATLMALFGWKYSRIAGIALTLYALIIFVGSVHLAWHYALDGYLGALGAWLIWWLVGRWQAVWGRSPAMPADPSMRLLGSPTKSR